VSELKVLSNNTADKLRVIVLLGIIVSIVDPFIAQSAIGQATMDKAKSVLTESVANSTSETLRAVEIEEPDFLNIFSTIASSST
jgi:hypothetical protein